MKTKKEKYLYFEVPGAGKIQISDHCHCLISSAVGFSFGVEWTKHKYVGGVLGRDEALRMANYIIETCKEAPETMEEELKRRLSEMHIPDNDN